MVVVVVVVAAAVVVVLVLVLVLVLVVVVVVAVAVAPPKSERGVLIDFETRFAPQRRALFQHLNVQKWHEEDVPF